MKKATLEPSAAQKWEAAKQRLQATQAAHEQAKAALAAAETERERQIAEDVTGETPLSDTDRLQARVNILQLKEAVTESRIALEYAERNERTAWRAARGEEAETQRAQIIDIATVGKGHLDQYLEHCRAARAELRSAVARFHQHQSRMQPFEKAWKDAHPGEADPMAPWRDGGRWDLDLPSLLREGKIACPDSEQHI